ncbi:polysaccharide pyruvyl transferase family protein [Thiocapsa rosea]|uniref:Polysaccharide pyruvyl transferase n=1 Tax=Thiocapsa rosea TaxID=69360 RepID=A0A495VDG0_9GAMM|nr:polysaccharide pyruvyl transferase family protein [Thiocapsa rosea]RKT47436.1 polysaccharide pyruvyl transferase [Thiocapsa rosea]
MQLLYFQAEEGNFGDDMNEWFWHQIIPEFPGWDETYTMLGIGTLLDENCFRGKRKLLIMGSGSTGYRPTTPLDRSRFDIGWVRGPLTASLLGLQEQDALTDPAYLLSELEEFKGATRKQTSRLLIPHHSTSKLNIDWAALSERIGLTYLSPCDDSKYVIERIRHAELVVSESMHGAIVADAFGVPWIPIAIGQQFNHFKWRDWGSSMNVRIDPFIALDELKQIYLFLLKQRRMLSRFLTTTKTSRSRVSGSNHSDENLTLRRVQKEDVAKLKRRIEMHSYLFERMLVRDLKNALRAEPRLSSEGIRGQRQEQMLSRLSNIRNRFSLDAKTRGLPGRKTEI